MNPPIRTYVICDGYGREVTEPIEDYGLLCASLKRIRREHPCDFYHVVEIRERSDD